MSAIHFDAAASSVETHRRHLYGPVADFLLLGGGSLFVLVAVRSYLGDGEDARAISLAVTLMLANLINYPHFAHSYQIFYQDFRAKLTSVRYSRDLRRLYLIAGVVVPIAVASFLTWAVCTRQPRALGLAANAMFFLVGWHYVKQGYGMAMVDAVLKKAFYDDKEKKALLANAYAAWMLSWLLVNYLLATVSTRSYWEIGYFVVPVPLWILWLAGALSLATSLRLALALYRRQRSGKALAWNGLVAYGVSLYAWLLIRDPIVLLWVPLFHSLQYLAVVWRFQSNRINQGTRSTTNPKLRMLLFLVIGFALGYIGFWALPAWLNTNTSYDRTIFGQSLYFYLLWIFINIHHYFLDTVMWRKGNPDVSRHLFQTPD